MSAIVSTTDQTRYVTRDPEYYEGEPMIQGTNVSTAQVFDALSFYLDHQAEIDAQIQVYIDRPFLDVSLSIRSYPYLDDVDATIEAYRREKNAEPWPLCPT